MPADDPRLAVLGETGWSLLLDAGAVLDAVQDPLAAAGRLAARRPDAAAPLRAAALELVTSGRRLAAKLGLSSEDGLLAVGGAVEQASAGRVATWHAQRVPEGLRVLEIGCGCGGDTLALAHRAANLIACDTDPVRAACTAHNLMALGLAHARAVPGDGPTLLGGEASRADAIFADPDRRPGGRRRLDPAAWSPPLVTLLGLATPDRRLYVKAAPSLDPATLPAGVRTTFVSHRRECVEAFLEAGGPASSGERAGGRGEVTAVLLPPDGPSVELRGDRSDAPVGPVGEVLHVPDPAALRARLLAELCRLHGLTLVGEGIAWMSGPAGVRSPWLTGHRVLRSQRFHEREVRAALSDLGAADLRVHTRAVPLRAEDLRVRLGRRLDRRGGGPVLDLFVTRVGGEPTAVITHRDDANANANANANADADTDEAVNDDREEDR